MDREHPLLFPLASTPVDGLSEEHPTTTNEPVLRDSISRLQLISPAQLFFYNNTKYKNAFSKLFKSLSMVPNNICTVMGDGGEADGRPGEQSRATKKKTAIPAVTFISEVTLPVYFTERIIDRDGPAPSGPLHHHKYYLLVSLFHLYICEGVTSNIVYFTPIKNIRNIVVCNKKVGEIVLKTANYYYRQRQKEGEAHRSVKTYCYGDCVFSLKDKNETDFLIHVIKQIISVPRTYFNFFFSGPSNGTETGKRFEFHDSFLASEEHWAKGDITTSRYANVVEHWPSAEVKALPSRLKPYFFYDEKRRNKKFPPLIAVYYEEVVNTRLFFRNDNNNNNNTNIKSELRFLETLFHLEPLEYTCASFDQQGNEKGDEVLVRDKNKAVSEDVKQVLFLLENGKPIDKGMEAKTDTKPEDHRNVHPDAVVPRGPSTTITMPNHKTTRHKELSVCLLGAANHSNPSTNSLLLNLKRDERKDAPHWKKLSPSASDRSEESETSSITVPISEESLTTGNDRNRNRTQFLEQMRQNNKMIREKQTEREIFNQHNKVKRITDAENELLNYERMLQLKFNYNAK